MSTNVPRTFVNLGERSSLWLKCAAKSVRVFCLLFRGWARDLRPPFEGGLSPPLSPYEGPSPSPPPAEGTEA